MRVARVPRLIYLSLMAFTLPIAAAAGRVPARTSQSVEDEVQANIRRERIGERTVDDDALPEAFLRRVADRVIRATYQQRYRVVIDDRGAAATQPGSAPAEQGE